MNDIDRQCIAPLTAIDPDVVVRRYFTTRKLESLVADGLYLSTAAQFSDELEGHCTHLQRREREEKLRRWGFADTAREMAIEANLKVALHNRQAVVISCWTKAPLGDPFWSAYGPQEECVAIETTVGTLQQFLGSQFLIVPVRYLDFERDRIPVEHSLQPYVFKHTSFSWEDEVRVIGEMERGRKIGTPRVIPVDLSGLVTRAVVSPYASTAFGDRVIALMKRVLGGTPVVRSAPAG